MKRIIDLICANILYHSQQLLLEEEKLASSLEDLGNTKGSFGHWLSAFVYFEKTKSQILSLNELVPNMEGLLRFLEDAQAIIAEKLVFARKNKHDALLFAALCRHSAIVKRVKGNHSRRRRKYYVVAEDIPEIMTRTA